MKQKTGKTAATDSGVKMDDEEESKRFIETAKKIEPDQSGRKLAGAMRKVEQSDAQKR